MKKLYFLAALFVILTSCSNDSDSVVEEPIVIEKPIVSEPLPVDPIPVPVIPVDTTTVPLTVLYIDALSDIDNKYLDTNNYDGNKILSVKSNSNKTLFTYEGNRIVKQVRFYKDKSGIEVKSTEVEYTYENGKLKTRLLKQRFSNSYPDGSYIRKTIYSHTSDNLISFVEYSIDSDFKFETKVSEGHLIYKNGNLIEEKMITNSATTIRKYEYDSKNNPFKNIRGFNLLLNEISSFGKNNVTKVSLNSTEYSAPATYLSTFIYNENEYPVKYTSFAKDGKTIEYEMEFTY